MNTEGGNYLRIFLLLLILIIPFVPFLLVLFKINQSPSFIKTWFSECYVYLTKLIRTSILIYGAILFFCIAACTIIKPLEFNFLATLDAHLKMFIVAWTLSIILTDLIEPTLSNLD